MQSRCQCDPTRPPGRCPSVAGTRRRHLREVRQRGATIAVRVKKSEATAKQRADLEARRRELEKKLAPRGSAASKLAEPWVDLTVVRQAIPADAMFIDIARFPISAFDKRAEGQSAPRY